VIDAPAADYPRVSAGLEVHDSADADWVHPLTRWTDEHPEYERALRDLLGTYAGTPDIRWRFSDDAANDVSGNPGFALGSDLVAPPRPRPEVSADRATIAIRTRSQLWNFGCRELGLWRVCGDVEDEYRISSRPIARTPRGNVVAEARFRGMEVVAADPVPDERSGDELRWELGPGSAADAIRVWVRPTSASTAALLDSNSGLWFVFAQPAAYVLSLLAVAIILLLILHRYALTAETPWRPLTWACRIAIAFGTLALAAWCLYLARYEELAIPELPWAEPLFWVLFAGAVAASVADRVRPQRPARWVTAVLSTLWLATLIARALASASGDKVDLASYGAPRVVDIALVVAAFALLLTVPRNASYGRREALVRALVAVALTGLAVGAWAAREVISIWPSIAICFGVVTAGLAWWIGAAWVPGRVRSWWLAGVAVVVAGISLAAWELFIRRADGTLAEQGSTGAGYARDSNFWYPPLLPRDEYREFAAGDLAPDVLLIAMDFVPYGILAAAATALHAEASASRDAATQSTGVLFAERSPAPAVLLVLFAAFVAGAWTWFFELRIPLALLLFLLLILVLGRRWREPSVGTRCVAGLPFVRRTDLLARPDAEGNGWGAVPCPLPVRRPAASRGRTMRALRALQRGFLPADADEPRDRRLEPVQAAPPGRVVLGLGPACTWWGNGLAAVKIGAVLAIVPALHYLSVLAGAQAEVTLRESPVGPLQLFGWALSEYAYWLVAAFVLGALLPYLPGATGVLKGAVLGVLYGITQFADHLLPGPYDVLGWVFIAASTTLYLCVVGFVLDLQTLRVHRLGWSTIGTHYGAPHARDVLAYALPLFILVGWVLQQALSGEAERAVGEFFQLAPSLVPQVR
jgi:hypothetical protein